MAILEGLDKRYFEIIPHPDLKGENVLAEIVPSIIEGDVLRRYWTFEELYEALERTG